MTNYQEVDIDKLIVTMNGVRDAYLASSVKEVDLKVDIAILKMNAHTRALEKLPQSGD